MLGAIDDFRRALLRWYRRYRRDLPWRVPPGSPRGLRPDPYHVVISEFMLQQTQVAAVEPFFRRFLAAFPTIFDLARADEQAVLRAWQGLGYYRRARHLHRTAQIIVERFGGQVPPTPEQLIYLPGVGRYTAGAIASLAFDVPAPVLDGNVARVLCRLGCIRGDPRSSTVRRRLWERAQELLPHRGAGEFNSAMMELGARICTSGRPRCMRCPVRRHCAALAAGVQERIPPPARHKPCPIERRFVLCIERGGRWLIEQRPSDGRWASMWQFVTVPASGGAPGVGLIGREAGLAVRAVRYVGRVRHELTHRRYVFEVYRCRARRAALSRGTSDSGVRRWRKLSELSDLPMSRPQQRIAALLGEAAG
jgi:A/G-specific adenine glycosylase